MSKTLVIVGCGAAKRDEVSPAKNLYTSTYFQKKREFAEQRGDFWQILSAEHGLLSPELEIPPYDTTISDLTDAELDQLAHEVGVDLIDWVAAHEICGETVSEIIILAGESYIEPLREREAFAAGIDERVSYPLQENRLGGIGEQMAWLDERASPGGEQSTLIPDGGETIDRFTELPTPNRFFMQIEPAEIEMQPMDHDEWLATINGELWDTTTDRRDLLRQVERVHHSDHSDATARDIHVFGPGESPNWMWDLATALPRKYEQEIEVEVETVDVPTVTDDELETMEDFL